MISRTTHGTGGFLKLPQHLQLVTHLKFSNFYNFDLPVGIIGISYKCSR